MTENKYNGWTNRPTWAVWLWLGDYFTTIGEEQEWDLEQLADHLKEETWNYLEFNQENGSLLLDIVLDYMSEVNWNEIAKHANQ
jgi:hypothetical protein